MTMKVTVWPIGLAPQQEFEHSGCFKYNTTNNQEFMTNNLKNMTQQPKIAAQLKWPLKNPQLNTEGASGAQENQSGAPILHPF